MKKGTSVIMAILMLTAGLHLSLATHYCCGELADVKLSITGQNASCGMSGESGSSLPSGKIFKKHCCDNELVTLIVDSTFSPSFTDFKTFAQPLLQLVNVPVDFSLLSVNSRTLFYTNASPPGNLMVSAVSLPSICVFRI